MRLGAFLSAVVLLALSSRSFAAEKDKDLVPVQLKIIPAHVNYRERVVACEPCYQCVLTPCFTETETPVYEWRQVDASVCVPGARRVSVVREECVRVANDTDPCGCSCPGTHPVIIRRTLGTGVLGTKSGRAVTGLKMWALVPAGVRIDRQYAGKEWRRIDVNHGKTTVVRSAVPVGPEAVTVISTEDPTAKPLPGTRRVITHEQWRRALEAARSNPLESATEGGCGKGQSPAAERHECHVRQCGTAPRSVAPGALGSPLDACSPAHHKTADSGPADADSVVAEATRESEVTAAPHE